MILQALYDYYEAMLKLGRIASPGLEYKPIRWVIVIKEDGSFVRIEDLKDPNDKKSKGQEFLVCAAKKRSGKCPPAQPFWDNRKYILGYKEFGGEIIDCTDRLNDFKKRMKEISKRYPNNTSFRAVCFFYDKYSRELSSLLGSSSESILSTDWLTFRLQGERDLVATQEDAYRYATDQTQGEEQIGRCLVTGERLPLANLHARVVAPGSQAGATVASFNDPAYLSYGKKQGANAPISKQASFAHTTALNSLLANERTRYMLGDISYLFWSSEVFNDDIDDAFRTVAFGIGAKDENADFEENQEEQQEERTSRRPKGKKSKLPNPTQDTYKVLDTFKAIRGNQGKGQFWTDTRLFYILGLSGGGRIAIKYWQRGTIAEVFDNVYQHLVDMNIISWDGLGDSEHPPLRSLYGILKTVSTPSKSSTFATNLIQSIVESILKGLPYPLTLQQACLNRIIHERKVTELRAAVLKGCINRKVRASQANINIKELDMSLDKQNNNIAYVTGRIFAVLEQIQSASLGKDVNATIRDRYYASASTRPNTVMGRLISLSNHHLSKLRKDKPGLAYHLERLLQEIFDLIPAETPIFPATFSLDEQSLFAVGYYHQKADSSKKETSQVNNQEEATE